MSGRHADHAEIARAKELLGAAVAGVLSDGERAELLELQSKLTKLGVDVPRLAEAAELAIGEAIAGMTPRAAAMPAEARDRLAALGERMVGSAGGRRPASVPFPRHGSGGMLGWTVAAGMALVATMGWMRPPRVVHEPYPEAPVSERREELLKSQDTMMLSWSKGQGPWGQVEGDIVWNNAKQEGYIRLRGAALNPTAKNNPSKEQYQLWIFDKSRDSAYPVDGGVFDVAQEYIVDEKTGDVIIPIRAKLQVFDPAAFAVTTEKPGGVVVTDRQRIVVVGEPKPAAAPGGPK